MAVCNTLPFAARKDTFCRLKGDVLQGKRYGFAVRWVPADLAVGAFALVFLACGAWRRGRGGFGFVCSWGQLAAGRMLYGNRFAPWQGRLMPSKRSNLRLASMPPA